MRQSLWVDVTTLLEWRGHFTGFTRTMASLLREWLGGPTAPLRCCRYDDGAARYLETPLEEVQAVIARQTGQSAEVPSTQQATRQTALLTAATPPGGDVATEARLLAQHTTAMLVHAARLARTCLQAPWRMARRLNPPRRAQPQRSPASIAPFEAGDTLLALGGGWSWQHHDPVLAELRRSRGLRYVPLVYDVIPCLLPHFFPPIVSELYEPWVVQRLRLADLVLTISQNSRRDLLAFADRHGISCPPVKVIRLGDEPAWRGPPCRPAELGDNTRFVLSVGTIEVRKNQQLLYHLWRRLILAHGAAAPLLVIAGQPGWLTEDLLDQIRRDPVVRQRILHLPAASDAEIAWLYRRCLFTLYPSLYEGWGLPVAESLAYGKDCIASSAASLPEIAPGLIGQHDPLDLIHCELLVTRALFDEAFRRQREQELCREFRITTWQHCGLQILQAVERAQTQLAA
jgi:glycosyltransferase involved in cell wall biosynthesis